MVAIELEKVAVAYGLEVILHDLNLRVPEGEFLVIEGPNGSGKTTLLKLLLGTLTATQGRVRVLDRIVDNSMRKFIGYVPQFHNLDPDTPLRTFDFVSFGLPNRWLPWLTAQERQSVDRVLKLTGALQFRNKTLSRLSGGQRQRAFLAQALVHQPRLLMLDEPTASLDPGSKAEIMTLIDEIRVREGLTVVLVTHDVQFVDESRMSVLHMWPGGYALHKRGSSDGGRMHSVDATGAMWEPVSSEGEMRPRVRF